jgi:hypothetical protein
VYCKGKKWQAISDYNKRLIQLSVIQLQALFFLKSFTYLNLNFFFDFLFLLQIEMNFDDVLAQKLIVAKTFIAFGTIGCLSNVSGLDPGEGLLISPRLHMEKSACYVIEYYRLLLYADMLNIWIANYIIILFERLFIKRAIIFANLRTEEILLSMLTFIFRPSSSSR